MKYYNNQNKDFRRKYDEKEYAIKSAPGIAARSSVRSNEQDASKKADAKSTSLTMKISVVAAALLLIAAVSVFIPLLSANAAYSDGYEVFLNGQSLGVVSDPQPVQQALLAIEDEFRQYYGMQIYDETALAFKKVKILDQYICPPDFYVQLIKQTVDIKVMAWVIKVNSRPAVALKTQQEANEVLARILSPYQQAAENRERAEIGFVENVEIVNDPIQYSNITDAESAYRIMVYGSADYEEKWHIVVTGERISTIAKKHGLKITDLRKANLSVAATDSIYPGDTLLVIKPNNCVNVKYVEIIDREEAYEEEPVIIPDDSMFKSQKKVQQQGIPGKRHVVAEAVYINGIEASYEIDAEKTIILEAAVPAVIVKGTKEVPKIVEMATEGDIPLPLKGHITVSSPFGKRDISSQLESASKNHNGVDLDADTGTPIYAPVSGTVTFAGSASGYGLLIKIDHGGGVETRYGHCSQLLVDKGEKVKAGQIIGLVGNTGGSTGSHLHFEVRINGEPVDPLG